MVEEDGDDDIVLATLIARGRDEGGEELGDGGDGVPLLPKNTQLYVVLVRARSETNTPEKNARRGALHHRTRRSITQETVPYKAIS